MKIFEHLNKQERVIIMLRPYSGRIPLKGSKSIAVVDSSAEELYSIILKALRENEDK